MALRWERLGDHGYRGLSGEISVAMLVQRGPDERWYWIIDGVDTRHIMRASGERKTLPAAKAQANLQFKKWCGLAGLISG